MAKRPRSIARASSRTATAASATRHSEAASLKGRRSSLAPFSLCWTGQQERSDEISLWTPDAAARLRADLRRARQPDGRAVAPLLAAGLPVGGAERPAEEGQAAGRGDRR